MITHYGRSVVTLSLLCLFLLTLAPVSSGQQADDVPVLIRDLKNKDAKIRAEAVRRLTPLGEAAKPAIPALVKALGDSDAKVRYRALIVLGHLWSGLERGPE